MIKIMLVEDDKSLREIYGVRLLAEGYDIVSAGDGEEALALSVKERPDLIITDVMMPKVSGYDMLDILRSTNETRDAKVIVMTALSSEEQRERGNSLGADKYLVKSQVGIEDVINAVHEVLNDKEPTTGQSAGPNLPQQKPSSSPAQPTVPPQAAAAPAVFVDTTPQVAPDNTPPVQVASPVAPPEVSSTSQSPVAPVVAPTPIINPAAQSTGASPAPNPFMTAAPKPTTNSNSLDPPKSPSATNRIIQPISSQSDTPDINELLNRELAKESGEISQTATSSPNREDVSTTSAEEPEPPVSPLDFSSQAQPPTPQPTPNLMPTPGIQTTNNYQSQANIPTDTEQPRNA